MEANRWAEVKRVFQVVLDLTPEDREGVLDEQCAGDAELRQEVDSLLRSYHMAGDLMERHAGTLSPTDSGSDPWLNRKIGPYQPVARIGAGGMGVVYRAVRVDDHYLKQLAIKVLRDGHLDPGHLRRFKIERQVLASLEHPNIAHLLDGGTTDDGHPYFVMEYVEGLRIDEYCDRHRLNTIERLKLFRQVCGAVQYAHQKLIVHRDLKPANILVTSDGTPKLLDFGIAKLLDPELFFQTVELTAPLGQPMTPDYASPEQVRGEGVTTASDVYSMGVILYRLLTGHPPYAVENRPAAEVAKTICEHQPEKPSLVIDRTESVVAYDGETITLTPQSVSLPRERQPAALRRRLAGDLDNIVLKALHKDPARRYGSAEQVGDDIGRYLDGLPILARPDTLFYRMGKYARRNRVPVIAAAMVLVSLLGGIVATMRQARIARAAQARAERRFNDVRKIAHDLIFEVHDSIQYLPGATSARKLIVQDALTYLDNLSKEAAGDRDLMHEMAIAYQKVGDVQGLDTRSNLGDSAGALHSYQRSVEIMESLVRANPGDRKTRTDLSDTYSRLAGLLLSMGRLDEAANLGERNLRLAQDLANSADRFDKNTRINLALAYDGLSNIQVEGGNFGAGVDSSSKALAIFEELLATEPANLRYRRGVALEHKKIGGIYEYTGKLDQAIVEYRKALPMDEARMAENPNDTLARRDVSISSTSVGDVLLKKGDAASALGLYRRAAAIDDAIAVADPKDAWAKRYQVYDYTRVGDALLKDGDLLAARTAFQKALTAAEARAALDSSLASAQTDLAGAYAKLGEASYAAGVRTSNGPSTKRAHLLTARAWYQKSMAVWDRLRSRGAMSAIDAKSAQSVADGLSRCEQALKTQSPTQSSELTQPE